MVDTRKAVDLKVVYRASEAEEPRLEWNDLNRPLGILEEPARSF